MFKITQSLIKPYCIFTDVRNLQKSENILLKNQVLVRVCLFICSLGSAKKCLSSTVPSAVTMATPTGFSSCAALKNVRLTYNTVSSMRAAGPQCSSVAKASPRDTVWCWFNSLCSAALFDHRTDYFVGQLKK